jgi:hypothetical protein
MESWKRRLNGNADHDPEMFAASARKGQGDSGEDLLLVQTPETVSCCIQAGVTPENIIAMYDTARVFIG